MSDFITQITTSISLGMKSNF